MMVGARAGTGSRQVLHALGNPSYSMAKFSVSPQKKEDMDPKSPLKSLLSGPEPERIVVSLGRDRMKWACTRGASCWKLFDESGAVPAGRLADGGEEQSPSQGPVSAEWKRLDAACTSVLKFIALHLRVCVCLTPKCSQGSSSFPQSSWASHNRRHA